MPPLYRSSPQPRPVSSRSRPSDANSSAQVPREVDETIAEPPVLMQLADFSHLAARRSSRRPTFAKSPIATTLPLPPPQTLHDEDLPAHAADESFDAYHAARPAAESEFQPEVTTAHGRDRRTLQARAGASRGAVAVPREFPTSTPEALAPPDSTDDALPHSPPLAGSPVPTVSARSSVAAVAAAAPPITVAPQRPLAPSESVRTEPVTVEVESTQASHDDHAAPAAASERQRTSKSSLADDDTQPVELWDKVRAYRPSLPVLLGLVLATIGVAYIFRPQETPPKRRGSPASTETRRQFDRQFDEQRPKSLSESPDANPTPRDQDQANSDVTMPTLDMPANAEPTTPSTPEPPAGDPPAGPEDSLRTPVDASPPTTPRTKLATRPAPTEHFESTPPPTMPDEPQVQPEGAATEEEDDGPPPDITGRTYPRTEPKNFYFRPATVETREASRPTTPQGETR